METTHGSAIEDIPTNNVAKMGREITRTMSSHYTDSSTLNHYSLLPNAARIVSADPGLHILDHAISEDIPEHVLRKVRSDIAHFVETAKPPYGLTSMQKLSTKLPFMEMNEMVKSLAKSNGSFDDVTNFAANVLRDSGAEMSMITAESIPLEMSIGQKQDVVYAFKHFPPNCFANHPT